MNDNDTTTDGIDRMTEPLTASQAGKAVEKGDYVYVTYNNTQGTRSLREGVVTWVQDDGENFVVDTLRELDDGTPVGFRVHASGKVSSTTNYNERRLTRSWGTDTRVSIVPADSFDGDTPGDQ